MFGTSQTEKASNRVIEAWHTHPYFPKLPISQSLDQLQGFSGISQTSLVLTDRSVSRGIPLWQGTTRRQQRPAALSDGARTAAGEEEKQTRENNTYRGTNPANAQCYSEQCCVSEENYTCWKIRHHTLKCARWRQNRRRFGFRWLRTPRSSIVYTQIQVQAALVSALTK